MMNSEIERIENQLKDIEIGKRNEIDFLPPIIDFNSISRICKLITEYSELSNLHIHYWEHCSFDTYQKTFDKRLEFFLEKYIDAQPDDFYRDELEKTKKSFWSDDPYLINTYSISECFILNTIIEGIDVPLYDLDSEIEKKFHLAYKRKIDFLNKKTDKFLSTPAIDETKKDRKSQETEMEIDFSDTNSMEKVIMLHRLGILDFLRKEHPHISINKLSSLLSSFTDIRQSTIQSYINPIYSEYVDQKNNPLNSSKREKVDAILRKLGIFN